MEENQGTFECEDGTMVFDSVNCPDAGPGAKERAAASKKEKEETLIVFFFQRTYDQCE